MTYNGVAEGTIDMRLALLGDAVLLAPMRVGGTRSSTSLSSLISRRQRAQYKGPAYWYEKEVISVR